MNTHQWWVCFLQAVLSGIVGCWKHLTLYKKLSQKHLQFSACFVNLSNFTFTELSFSTVKFFKFNKFQLLKCSSGMEHLQFHLREQHLEFSKLFFDRNSLNSTDHKRSKSNPCQGLISIFPLYLSPLTSLTTHNPSLKPILPPRIAIPWQ